MRSRLLVLVVLLVAASAAFSYSASAVSAHSVAAPHSVAAQAAGCTDATFLGAVSKDFSSVGDFMKQIDSGDATHLIATQLVLTALRQKYEDMSAPAECLASQLSVIVVVANLNDLITLKLASVVDTANAASYQKDIDAQVARNAKLVQQFVSTLPGGAATPAASS